MYGAGARCCARLVPDQQLTEAAARAVTETFLAETKNRCERKAQVCREACWCLNFRRNGYNLYVLPQVPITRTQCRGKESASYSWCAGRVNALLAFFIHCVWCEWCNLLVWSRSSCLLLPSLLLCLPLNIFPPPPHCVLAKCPVV